MLLSLTECVQESDGDRKEEREKTGCLSALNYHFTLFHKAAEEKRDKYGVFLEWSLTAMAWGERQIDLLEQLVLLMLAKKDINQ